MSEFLSPKIRDTEVDLSLTVSGGSSSVAAVVVKASKGPVNEAKLITSIDDFIEVFGKPKINDKAAYTAIAFLSKGFQLWVIRYTDGTATFSDSIVRALALVVTVASGDGTAAGQMQAIASYSDSSTGDVTADADIVWESDNELVATVDAVGAVTGVADGAATITATLDGVAVGATFTVDIP